MCSIVMPNDFTDFLHGLNILQILIHLKNKATQDPVTVEKL